MSEYSIHYPAFEKFLNTPLADLDHGQFMIILYAAQQEIKGIPPEKVVAITKGILRSDNERTKTRT